MDELKFLSREAAKGRLSRRDFLGRASALGLTAAAASTMLSDAARAASHAKKGGHFKIGSVGGESTNTQDPALTASQVPYHNLRQWGETLVEVSPTGEVTPKIAESYEASADAKTWAFKIRKGVEYHGGGEVSVDDVVKTMQRHSNEESKSGALGIMKGISDVKADGDNLVVTLETANADLPYLIADYHLIIQPNGGMDAPAAGNGTGPFKLVEDEPGVRHGYERFANYWDADTVHFDSVEILVINDATARTAALQSGQVHMINRVEPKIASLVDRAPGVSVKNVAGRGHYVFIMHTDTAPFDNNDLRLALKYAINRQELVDKVLRGYGSVGNDMPINKAYPLFDESIPQRAYDPDKAKFHYKKSGHDGPIVLRTSDAAFPGALDASQLFQASAQAAGIPLELKREPADGYWSEVWNKQPFCASYWGGRPVQDQMYTTAYLSTADWNDTRFKRDDFDALLLQARAELDLAKRKELYSQMGYMVRDEGGLILPMFNDFVDAVSDKVAGYEPDPNGEFMNGYASHKCWFA